MYSVGIDLGGTNIACGLVDDEGKLILKKSVPTLAWRSAEEIMEDMANTVRALLSEKGISEDQIRFCGIASPGTADCEKGIIEYSCNLPCFNNFNIVESLQRRFPTFEIGVENDANCAAKGEAEAGAAKDYPDSVLVTLGTGVGGGVIQNGKILHGINFAGAELGHTVISFDGQPCSCGRKGCWEAYSSATALIRMTKEAMEKDRNSLMWQISEENGKVDGRTAFSAKYAGDKTAFDVVEKYIRYLACGITNMINIFQPDVLSVGGGISGEGEKLLAPVREIVEREQYSRNCKKKTIVRKAQLGNDAGIIGAALLWR